MPAYFSIGFELNKSKTVINDFCNTLIKSGLVFKSGYWMFENDSFDDIIAWNQEKLDNNFQLGDAEDFSHDYKQILFDFADFSEVRLYLINNQKYSTVHFYLIIPEDDFFSYGDKDLSTQKIIDNRVVPKRLYQKMDLVKDFVVKIWENSSSLAIQTGWETSNLPALLKEIEEGVPPLCEPLCIMPRNLMNDSWNLDGKNIAKDGILLEDKDNWNNVFANVDSWIKL